MTKVIVALSGGVDSAVAAALLIDQGYDVTGAFMVNYDESNPAGEHCWVPDYQDAVRVAATLSIPLIKLDFIADYKATVLDSMFEDYARGLTPNPDVLCNKYVKFGSWLEKIKKLGFSGLATGHYAQIRKKDGRFQLLRAVDENKDQTYFLHALNQEQLSTSLFPIGEYTKPEVRALAKKYGLPVAEKEESMGICFIGEVPMKEFLQTRIKKTPGNVVMSNGTVIGEHEGLPFYTIGQRHGFNMSLRGGARNERRRGLAMPQKANPRDGGTRPLYVVKKRTETNELVVGFDNDPLLYKTEINVEDNNWISGQAPDFHLECQVRLRHRQPLQPCGVTAQDSGLSIAFDEPQRAITAGQCAVFYQDQECLGGGEIIE